MKESIIQNEAEMLYYRTLLCFLEEEEKDHTVTAIARKLDVEKYQISRILSSLEEKGIVDRSEPRKPKLTVMGRQYLLEYERKVHLLMDFLTFVGLKQSYLRLIAMHIAGHAEDEIINLIREKTKKLYLIEKLQKFSYINGKSLCKVLGDGTYHVSLLLLKYPAQSGFPTEIVKNHGSMEVTLSVKDGQGMVQIHFRTYGREKKGQQLKDLQYMRDGVCLPAERYAHVFCIPCEAFSLTNRVMGGGNAFAVSGAVDIRYRLEGSETYEQGAALLFL